MACSRGDYPSPLAHQDPGNTIAEIDKGVSNPIVYYHPLSCKVLY